MRNKPMTIEQFIASISNEDMVSSKELTNLYYGNSQDSSTRRENLRLYLEKMRTLNPSILLLGEAPGYKGCGLTGIPFTSEEVLNENDFFKGQGFTCINNIPNLKSEMSATIVWDKLAAYSNKPLIWNIFPFHPHKSCDINTNRTPTKKESAGIGMEYLKLFLKIFNIRKIIALGKKPGSQINNLGLDYACVRHPAHGGKIEFIKGLELEMK